MLRVQWEVRLDKKAETYEGNRKIWKDFTLRRDLAEFMPSRDCFDGSMGGRLENYGLKRGNWRQTSN